MVVGSSSGEASIDGKQQLDCAAAEVLGGKICAAASLSAQSECQLLELIGEFDAGDAVRWWDGVKSLAHWLSWACSMSPGTAREHVRVARALRQMPTVLEAFREGRLSYSKVREVTRVVDLVDESELCELALTATAAQLAKMISSYRTAAGTRIKQERLRGLTWTERESGIVDVRVRLPKEEAAVLLAALNAAKDQHGASPAAASSEDGDEDEDAPPEGETLPADENQVDTTPAYGLIDAMVDVARVYLSTALEDRSGEDRSLVVVHVSAELLADSAPHEDNENVPAGTSSGHSPDDRSPDTEPPEPSRECDEAAPAGTPGGHSSRTPEDSAPAQDTELGPVPGQDVPAGTSSPPRQQEPTCHLEPTCHIDGVGGIEPETARKLSCDADLLGAIIDDSGDVLALGRTRRLVSRSQRRALMIRDHGICQFAGCHQTHHLQAHHLIHWVDGGRTDLDNLVLLCQRHHTVVHEGGMIIRRVSSAEAGPASRARRWEFLMPDGKPHREWYTAEGLLNFLAQHADKAQAEQQRLRRTSMIDNVVSFHDPYARRIQPGWRGERFDLHECVQTLFRMQPTWRPEPPTEDDLIEEQAA